MLEDVDRAAGWCRGVQRGSDVPKRRGTTTGRKSHGPACLPLNKGGNVAGDRVSSFPMLCVVVLRSDVRAQQPQGMALPCRLYLLLRVRISMAARETLHPYRWLLGDPTV